MKIIFFGTGEFSANILRGLLSDNREVVAVVSQPDKVNARNGKIKFSAIKNLCLEKGIPLYQFERVSREGEETLRMYTPDLFVTASYGQIIKQNILDIPKYGTVNVHGSLLPKYRGPAPIQWAIMNGETKTGITIMRTDIGVDTGDVYFSREIDISDEDTASSVFDKLSTLGIECLKEFLDNFDYYIDRHIPQNHDEMTYFPMIKKEDYALSFNLDAKVVANKIRGLEDCYFLFKGARYKVKFARAIERKGKAGEVILADPKQGFVVACKTGAIEIVKIQPEGKQVMDAKSYMNARKFEVGDIIGNIK